MANPTCTVASLITNNPCFSAKVLDEQHQLALKIWFMANELSVIGGTNYTNTLTSTLLTDATALYRTMNPSQRQLAILSIYKNNAVNAGATISSDIQALMASIKCLVNMTPDQLQQAEILLLCQLGFHKTRPQ